jgi:hypothetical protein
MQMEVNKAGDWFYLGNLRFETLNKDKTARELQPEKEVNSFGRKNDATIRGRNAMKVFCFLVRRTCRNKI